MWEHGVYVTGMGQHTLLHGARNNALTALIADTEGFEFGVKAW